MASTALNIPTPRWAVKLLAPARYKGAKGGRGSGKSHFFAELAVEECVANPHMQIVCIREVQKSLKFSAKKLIEDKIRSMGVSHLFDVTLTEIKRKGGNGIIIFQGMQDHTADSIKSLEGFKRAWVEEAQSLSARSLELLLPTIRDEDSEIWFSWNPYQSTDPVDRLLVGEHADPDAVVVHVNYSDNPFLPATLRDEANKHMERSPQTFNHVWLGTYADNGEDMVIPLAWVLKSVKRWHELSQAGEFALVNGRYKTAIGAIGVDVADRGDDSTVFAPRMNYWVPKLDTFHNIETMETAGHCAVWSKLYPQANINIDVIGIGSGVVSRCREQHINALPFNASEGTDRKDRNGIMEFLNCRSAAWWNMREVLDPANGFDVALPDDPELIGDLTAPRWKLNSSGRIQVEGANHTVLFPEGLRDRLGRSPDKGTAVVQAFWTPARVEKKPETVDSRPQIFKDIQSAIQGQKKHKPYKMPAPTRI